MWDRFTEQARKVVFYAQEEAGAFGDSYVSTEHLLLGITRLPENAGIMILERLGVTLVQVRSEIERQVTHGDGRQGEDMLLTPRAQQVIDFAHEEAKRLRNNYIGVEHLLLGLLREGEGLAGKTLARLGVTLEAVRNQLPQLQDKRETSPFDGPKPEELLSLDEAVKFLGTSKPTLYRLLGQDEIKGLKVGRQWRFRRGDLIAYMERGPVAFAAAPKEDLDVELAFFAEQLGHTDAEFSGDAEAKTVRLAQQIVRLAIQARASDIHLEATAHDLRLRLRVDGVLQETRRLPVSVREALTAQIKTMAEMDMNEKKLPQDGRIPVKHDGKDFDLRVACIPSVYGEALTIRILDRGAVLLGFDRLGMSEEDVAQIRTLMHLPNGIFLATGPTGSGKTTLLYTCLQEVAGGEKKTLTVEDPVEYILENTTQTQVNKKAGLTFAAGLRALLRQDPDIIMVGEIPSLETAQITVEASLTGHLLLTSLHTGDAPSALLRMVDMGVEPYLVSATVAGAAAVRLCRKICDSCKAPVEMSGNPTLGYVTQLAAEGGYQVPADAVFYRGGGCEQCRGGGYRGRIGLYEVLTVNDALTEALLRRAPLEEMTEIAVAGGMRTLLADGIRKAAAGQTTVEEVLRVVSVAV